MMIDDAFALPFDDIVKNLSMVDLTFSKGKDELFLIRREYKAFEGLLVPYSFFDQA